MVVNELGFINGSCMCCIATRHYLDNNLCMKRAHSPRLL